MERRTFLTGGAASVVGISTQPAAAQSPPVPGQPLSPTDLQSTVARLRAQFLKEFDPAYVENVIVPWFLVSIYAGEKLPLPMIGLKLTKENALPFDLWGLLSETWKPSPEDGVTVFLQGLEKRGPENRRKRIYMSAVTPDLYRPMYSAKVMQFFDKLLDDRNAGKPLMRPYLEGYFDMYWDLHLGVKGEAIPARVRRASTGRKSRQQRGRAMGRHAHPPRRERDDNGGPIMVPAQRTVFQQSHRFRHSGSRM
jgi:hypothetical protein